MSQYEQERAVAREAAQLAGRLCLTVREQMLGNDLSRLEKVGREPVTIADYGAQAVVLQHIAQHFPDDGSICEEQASQFNSLASDAQQLQITAFVSDVLKRQVSVDDLHTWLDWGSERQTGRVWTVDPIDGTKGFLRGDQFAVAVALLVDGLPVVGALACPLLPFDPDKPEERGGVIAVAVMEEGAMIEPLNGDAPPRPMKITTLPIAQARTVESVEAGHTDHSFSAQVLKRAGVAGDAVGMDSQAKYVALADGRAEIYLRNSRGEDYREKIWDHAAGVLVVQEAGGQITDLNGAPLDFSQGARLVDNRGVLASNIHPHEALLAAIRAQDADSQ